jgi:hypothetical protein
MNRVKGGILVLLSIGNESPVVQCTEVQCTEVQRSIPGTNIPYRGEPRAFAPIRSLIDAAGGFGLSQICAITGLEGSTIQNWLKRGWLGKVIDKKYDAKQVARIIIFNALRGCLKLDDIAELLKYVNGRAGDKTDDIIGEDELYNYFVAAVYLSDGDSAKICKSVDTVIEEYNGEKSNSKKLKYALTVMTYAEMSTELGNEANLLLYQIKN